MQYERDSQELGGESEQLRQLAVAKGKAWTAGQAERLDISTEEILAAVRRDWLPENIEAVSNRYALQSDPPLGAVRFKIIREPAQREGTEPRARNRAARDPTASACAYFAGRTLRLSTRL